MLAIVLFWVLPGANAQDFSKPIPVDKDVTVGQLSNGLTYYIRPNSKPEKKVELRLVVNAGSILEEDSQQGLAHFMEHMNFNGSKNFKKNDLVSYLQSIGVQFGADLNAYTSFDQTVYILPIPTDRPGNLEKGFQILEDWAHNALLTDKDIDEERGVVLEESRARGKNASERMMQQYLPQLLEGSKYASRLPIGKDEILKTFKYDEIRRFYKDWYRPDLMAVVVVGDITKDQAEKMIKKHFAGIQSPKTPKKREYAEIYPYKEDKAMVVTDKEATNFQFILSFSGSPTQPVKTLKDLRNQIIRSLFTQMLNKRYNDLAKSANPPYIYANSSIGGLLSQRYEQLLLMAMPNKDIEQSVDAAIAEFLRAQKYGFNTNELELAKKSMMSYVENRYNERSTTESSALVEEYISNYLIKEPIPGIENEYNFYKDVLPGITLEEVWAEATKWLAPDATRNYFALLTGPQADDTQIPSSGQLLEMVKNAFNQTVEAKQDKVTSDQLLEHEPVAGKVVGQQKNDKLGIVTYSLSNGIKVTVKKTDFKSDEILLEGVRKGGTSNFGPDDKSNVHFISDVIESMGYGQFTPTELGDALTGKNITLTQSMDETTDKISGSSSVKDFMSLMELVHLQMTSPRLDTELYEGYMGKMKMQLMFMKANPQVVFVDTLFKVMYNNNPLRPIAIPTLEDIEKINPERVVEIYKNEFGNAYGFHFFLTGNIDETTLIPLLEKYIASLPSSPYNPSFKDNGVDIVPGNKTFEFKKGENQKSLIVEVTHGTLPFSEDLDLKTSVVGDILTIRLLEEVREKMGAIYSGAYTASMEQFPAPKYQVLTQMQCGPENVEPILAKLKDLVNEIKNNGPSETNLSKAKNAMLEKRKELIKTNEYWNRKLIGIEFWGNSAERFLDMDNVINRITVKDIQDTAKKLFDGKNEFIGIMNPEKIDSTEK